MKRILILFLILFPLLINAQTILMEEDVIGDTIPKKFGPNLKHYTHTYMGFGIVFGSFSSADLSMLPGKSTEFNSGFRYKNKLSESFAACFNIAYATQTFRLNPPLNNFVNYDKQKFTFNNVELGVFGRINFGKRGNIVGKYVDLGVYGDYSFISKHYLRIDNSNYNSATSKFTELIEKKLDYFNPLNFGVAARVGWEWLAIYGKYRISSLTKNNPTFPELPKFTIGIELSIIN